MELTINQIKLGQPYKPAGLKSKPSPFIVFLNRKENSLVLEFNPSVGTILTQEIYTGKEKKFYIKEHRDSRYVIKVLFKASHFIAKER